MVCNVYCYSTRLTGIWKEAATFVAANQKIQNFVPANPCSNMTLISLKDVKVESKHVVAVTPSLLGLLPRQYCTGFTATKQPCLLRTRLGGKSLHNSLAVPFSWYKCGEVTFMKMLVCRSGPARNQVFLLQFMSRLCKSMFLVKMEKVNLGNLSPKILPAWPLRGLWEMLKSHVPYLSSWWTLLHVWRWAAATTGAEGTDH